MVGNAIICIARDESCAIIHSYFPTCLQLLLIMMSTATQAGAVPTQPWDCSCVAEVCQWSCWPGCATSCADLGFFPTIVFQLLSQLFLVNRCCQSNCVRLCMFQEDPSDNQRLGRRCARSGNREGLTLLHRHLTVSIS